jgi:hypothetical protein
MADAIFTLDNSIEAIIYPSVQNCYGTNLALKKLADNLEIKASFVNKLKKVYSNEFLEYETIMECTGFDKGQSLVFSEIGTTGSVTYRYR